jgi:hypothetical protein
MNETPADALLSATLELWLERRRATAGFHDTALPDVAAHMLRLGVLARSDDGKLISRAGGSPDDILALVRRKQAYLFKRPDDAAPAPAPKPNPKGLSPDARLALANGHEPMRPDRGR